MKELVVVKNLCKYFSVKRGTILERKTEILKAVDDVSFTVHKGEVKSLVGETGSGKTTIGKTILRIYRPTSGQIWIDGADISNLESHELKDAREKMSMVFQDPISSLNPRRRIKDIIADPAVIHRRFNRSELMERVRELLAAVELPEDFMFKRPTALSGGECQRVGIARALVLNPKFVVLDEPTSSLDVSVQAKILTLLKKLQSKLDLSYLLITHNLAVVRNFTDRVAVIYLGKVLEAATNNEIFTNALHPYTMCLLSSIPVIFESELRLMPRKMALKGDIPSPFDVPRGCVFNTRCPVKLGRICELKAPEIIEVENGHYVRCHKFR